MKPSAQRYMSNRVLKLNVGFLLSAGAGHSHDSELNFPVVRVSDDLILNYIRGPIRLSRTKEGVLVQAELATALDDECYRCLEPTQNRITLHLEELFARDPRANAAFFIGEDAILDLAPLLREEVLIEKSHGALCQAGCKGLCPQCGANLNHTTCDCNLDEIDPRWAALKELLDSN